MNVTVTALGAVIALVIAITLIVKKVHPAYGLILGALIGGLVGGAGLTGTVNLIMDGAKNMMPGQSLEYLQQVVTSWGFN